MLWNSASCSRVLSGWLVCDGDDLAASFRGFVGNDGYGVDDLRADLSQFAFLLGGNDGELLFDRDER